MAMRGWTGFAVGFVVFFLAIAFLWPMSFYDGKFVYRTTLGPYYLLEIRRALGSSGNLGPFTGNQLSLVGIAVVHFMFAFLAGWAVIRMARLFAR